MFMIYFLLFAIIPMLLLSLSYLMTKKLYATREKSTAFECGFDPICSSRSPFSLRFFLLAVLFLVFDIEIVLLLPIIMMPNSLPPFMLFLSVMFFITILLVGLIHEWKEGSLDWSD